MTKRGRIHRFGRWLLRRKGLPHVLDLLAWNCYRYNDSDVVLHWLRVWVNRYKPDMFALSEASTHAHVLPLLEGYSVQQQTPPRNPRKDGEDVDDTGDVAILVRDDHIIKRNRLARMLLRWLVLSHRRWHKPHEYEVTVVKVRGHKWRVCVAHPPTHGFTGPNREAFAESTRFFRRWLRRGFGRPSIVVGDLNEHSTALATWFGPKYRVWGEGIDCAVTRGVRTAVVEELGKGGGDHYGRRYQFESAR